ncbi:MAG: hypothetical protein A2284_06640 [Deltaproteobacteria bacterium RIFOXYA12_FULL_61_11]|nr:MAG: hypothetical protein A2284_06640 [Deltaproteobacteria bacterium RIFOXYA12_FULL_61_11]
MNLASFSSRLVLSSALGVALITVFLTVLFACYHQLRTSELADQEEQTLVRTFGLGVRDFVLTHDYASLDEFVKSLAGNRRILYLVVGSKNDEIIAKYTSPGVPVELLNQFIWQPVPTKDLSLERRELQGRSIDDVFLPLTISNHLWGWVRIGFDRSTLELDFATLLQLGLLFLLLAVLLALGLGFLLARRLRLALAQVDIALEHLTQRRYDKLVAPKVQDEVGTLLDRCHRLATQLKDHQEQQQKDRSVMVRRLDEQERELVEYRLARSRAAEHPGD